MKNFGWIIGLVIVLSIFSILSYSTSLSRSYEYLCTDTHLFTKYDNYRNCWIDFSNDKPFNHETDYTYYLTLLWFSLLGMIFGFMGWRFVKDKQKELGEKNV